MIDIILTVAAFFLVLSYLWPSDAWLFRTYGVNLLTVSVTLFTTLGWVFWMVDVITALRSRP